MKVFNNHFKLVVLIILILGLTGCFNLGDFESDQDYFDTFEEVELVNLSKIKKGYSTEDYFYTEEGINDYECDVPMDYYIYAFLEVKKDILLDDLSLSFYSDVTSNLYISVFLVDAIPSNIQGFDDKVVDDEGNDIEYDDPVDAIETCIVPLESGSWKSTMILDYPKNNYLNVIEGQYLLLRFENNSFKGFQNGYCKLEFTLTNLLICAQRS